MAGSKAVPEDYYDFERKDLVDLVPKIIGNVLDIGCGSGATMRYLLSRGAENVVGVDVSDQALAVARERGFQVFNVNLNEEKLPFTKNSFDLIIFADVLEHLIDPWMVLSETKEYLNNDGFVLLSLPNIRNYKILRRLIFFDRWDYEDAGILDKTHLRFFTKKTIQRMVSSAGYKVFDDSYSTYDKKIIRIFNKLTFGFFVKFTAVQFYFLIKKSDELL